MSKQFATEEDNKILMKHNSLIKAKYNLTLVQNRVFELLLYKFQKEKDGILSCEVCREELKNLIGKEKKKTVKGISDLLESLRLKEILIAEKIEGKNKFKWHRFGLINGAIYDEDKDVFIVKATEEIYTLIQNYYDKREGHTPINLIVKLGMNNYYAQRLYDLIRVWSGTKKIINYEVEELKDLLQINDKYPLYADFKRRVIVPSIKELNKTGYFKIEYTENKLGKKVESIDFIVSDLDKRKYFDSLSNIKIKNEREIEESIRVDEQKISKSKEEIFYVPNKKLFTAKTLENFKNDFSNYDFKDSTYKRLLQDSILVTLEKDDEEKIKVKSYNYFKKTLENKIVNSNKSKNNVTKPVKTRFHNVNETFKNYGEDELEKMLLESQRGKFNNNK